MTSIAYRRLENQMNIVCDANASLQRVIDHTHIEDSPALSTEIMELMKKFNEKINMQAKFLNALYLVQQEKN